MRSQLAILKAFAATPLLVILGVIMFSGCKGGLGRNINPYAAYGSPRIAPPGTGAIGPQSANPSNAVGTGVSANGGTPTDNGFTGSANSTLTGNGNASQLPYYSGNSNDRDGATYGGTGTGSVPSTPVSGGNRWRDRSSSLPQSRIPSQGTSTPGSYNSTRPYTTSNESTQDLYDSQVAPASYNSPVTSESQGPTQQASVNQLLNGMRVNDATGQAPPRSFTPPENARPLSNAPTQSNKATEQGISQPDSQSGWSSQELHSLSQQGTPLQNPSNNVAVPASSPAELTEEEFAAFVQGQTVPGTRSTPPTQSVAVVSTLPYAGAFNPNAELSGNASAGSSASPATSGGWRTRDE